MISLIEKLLVRNLKYLIKQGSITLVMASGKRFHIGDAISSRLQLRFADNLVPLKLLMDPELQLGELFMNKQLLVEQGSIYDLLELLLRHTPNSQAEFPLQKILAQIRMSLRRFSQRNLPQRAQRNVAYHYDLSDKLYNSFLDSDRQYSCAYFEYPGQSLENAQLAKKRHIAAKLLIQPGQRVLDIGCGWGGLSRYLASVAQAREVVGITLSKEQLDYAQTCAAKQEVAKLHYRLEDYRSTGEQFQRIVSVGMFEHVGLEFYLLFFKKCYDLLTDDGVMLLHFIGNSVAPHFTNPWIEKYIFPGGHIPSLSECLPAIERAGFIVTDIEILRLHYAETLSSWRERFFAHHNAIKNLYDDRFCRMWEFYLSCSEAAFRYRKIAVFQIQLAKQLGTVPLTRDYIDMQKEKLRRHEQNSQTEFSEANKKESSGANKKEPKIAAATDLIINL